MDKKMFQKGGVFWKRGVTPEVAEGAFFPYIKQEVVRTAGAVLYDVLCTGDPTKAWGDRRALEPDEVQKAQTRVMERGLRAPGMMMRRFPVPGSDPLLFAEQRPDRAIWTGKPLTSHKHSGPDFTWGSRQKHEHPKNPSTPADVRRGMTNDELGAARKREGWAVTEGADHRERTGKWHVHVKLAKYIFPVNSKTTEEYEHTHRNATPKRLKRHLRDEHDWPEVRHTMSKRRQPADPVSRELFRWARSHGLHGKHVDLSGRPSDVAKHTHERTVDEFGYARRLSSHPMGFARIADANVVCFALEGCLKEAALVSAGEATFSCPSVTLWNAPEFPGFVANHLAGKLVLVIPDSDAWENDAVIRQSLLAVDALRTYGADAEVAIPTPEPKACARHGAKSGAKRGVDDFLADGGRVEQMVWMTREPGRDLAGWLEEHDIRSPSGRKPRSDRVGDDDVILRHIAIHANEAGKSRAALQSVAEYVWAELKQRGHAYRTKGSVVSDVADAVQRLDGYGALSGAETLADRKLWMDPDEWPGELVVHKDLRAITHKATVADLLRQQ
jgi:hypothetical protein